jgi:hypothetical protein
VITHAIQPRVRGYRRLWAAQKREFDLQAFALAPKIANERKRTAADPEMPAIVLDVANIAQRICIKK